MSTYINFLKILLFTMTNGIYWNHRKGYDDSTNMTTIMEKEQDWIAYILKQRMLYKPGTKFKYKDCDTVLLGDIFRMVVKNECRKVRQKIFI